MTLPVGIELYRLVNWRAFSSRKERGDFGECLSFARGSVLRGVFWFSA